MALAKSVSKHLLAVSAPKAHFNWFSEYFMFADELTSGFELLCGSDLGFQNLSCQAWI